MADRGDSIENRFPAMIDMQGGFARELANQKPARGMLAKLCQNHPAITGCAGDIVAFDQIVMDRAKVLQYQFIARFQAWKHAGCIDNKTRKRMAAICHKAPIPPQMGMVSYSPVWPVCAIPRGPGSGVFTSGAVNGSVARRC